MKFLTILILPCVLTALGLFSWYFMVPISDPRERAEHEHGLQLPRSAHAIQGKGDAWLHVELWKLHDDAMIVKMFTAWN